MGGGADSRIPNLLRERMKGVNVLCRTYDFNPTVASNQLSVWFQDWKPDLVIGESLGSLQALKLRGVPHLFVSPALNSATLLHLVAPLTLIPGMRGFLGRSFKPREGDRQHLDFSFKTLRNFSSVKVRKLCPTDDYVYAFFGTKDHYRRSGIVSVRTWRNLFGEGTWTEYDGTHYMEEEFIDSLLIPKIQEILGD